MLICKKNLNRTTRQVVFTARQKTGYAFFDVHCLPQLFRLHFTTPVRANPVTLDPQLQTLEAENVSTRCGSRAMQYFLTNPTLEVIVNWFYEPLKWISAVHFWADTGCKPQQNEVESRPKVVNCESLHVDRYSKKCALCWLLVHKWSRIRLPCADIEVNKASYLPSSHTAWWPSPTLRKRLHRGQSSIAQCAGKYFVCERWCRFLARTVWVGARGLLKMSDTETVSENTGFTRVRASMF